MGPAPVSSGPLTWTSSSSWSRSWSPSSLGTGTSRTSSPASPRTAPPPSSWRTCVGALEGCCPRRLSCSSRIFGAGRRPGMFYSPTVAREGGWPPRAPATPRPPRSEESGPGTLASPAGGPSGPRAAGRPPTTTTGSTGSCGSVERPGIRAPSTAGAVRRQRLA